MNRCEFNGCTNKAQPEARLCSYHLSQIDCPKKPISNELTPDDRDNELDLKLEELINIISKSEQMIKLTKTIMDNNIMNEAVNSFDSLASLSTEAKEDLMTFISVNIVSSIIQEKANFLLRAGMIAEAFPNEQGLQEFINFELESLNSVQTR